MKEFFKYFLATIAGLFVTLILVTLIFVGIIGAALSGGDKKEAKVKDNTVLHIKLDGPIAERGSKNPFEDFDPFNMEATKSMGLNEILENIEKAKEDDRIKGIFLDISIVQGGMATVEEVRNALIDFKESGKFIISYSEIFSQKAYYLASVSDQINVNPAGILEFKGLGTQMMFFKKALEKLEVEMQIIRGTNNKFKSAVEPFMYEKMSPANREQVQKFLDAMWNHMLAGISKERNVSVEELNRIADGMLIRDGDDAVEYKLADKSAYYDEVMAEIRTRLEIEEDKDINMIALSKYSSAKSKNKLDIDIESKFKKDKIAIVYAYGEIQGGKNKKGVMGSESIAEAIKEARKDSTVKAVVLRVNSPGGSALASDVMWREIILTKKVKPVIVSMGDVAASGGYYISCAADKIYAQPNTITGSIGVFGTLPNAKGLFENKLGITMDTVNTNRHSDIMNLMRPLTPEEYSIIQQGVDKIYDDFITKVADGRKMTKEMVDSIGQGRVWAGTDALSIGLVDEIGGVEDAIEYAAELAKLGEDYAIKSLPKQKDPFEEFMLELSGEMEAKIISNKLGDNYRYIQVIEEIVSRKGYMARMPYDVVVY
jgi:protease-4